MLALGDVIGFGQDSRLQFRTPHPPPQNVLNLTFKRPKSSIRTVTSTTDPDIFEKYRDTPPMSIAVLLQRYALLLAKTSIYTTNLSHDTPSICTAILLRKYYGQKSLEHPQFQAKQWTRPQNPKFWGFRSSTRPEDNPQKDDLVKLRGLGVGIGNWRFEHM